MRQAFLKSISSVPVEEAHGGSGRRQMILSGKDPVSPRFEALARTVLESGSAFDWHEHPGVDEFFIVQAGQGTVAFKDGVQCAYKAGDVVYMPADLAHRIEALGAEASVFFFVRFAA